MPSGIGLNIHDSFDVRITGAIEFSNFTTGVNIVNDVALNSFADARYARHVQIESLNCYSNTNGLTIDGVTGGVTIGTIHLSNITSNFNIDSPHCSINGGQITGTISHITSGGNYTTISGVQFNRNFATHIDINGVVEGVCFNGCVFEKGAFGGAVSLTNCTGVGLNGGVLDGQVSHSTSAGTQYVQISNMFLGSGYSTSGTTAQILVRDCFSTAGAVP